MKRFFILYLFITGTFSAATGQVVPNGNFEEWETYFGIEQPSGWITSNFIDPRYEPVVKTDVRKNGAHAIKLQNVHTDDSGIDSVLPGIAWTCNIFEGSGGLGFPCTNRPRKLSFYYKYEPVFGDTMVIGVGITKYKGGAASDTIGYGVFMSNNVVSGYTYGEIEIYYATGEIPDTAFIVLSSGNVSLHTGSTLYVDYMNFDMHLGESELTEGKFTTGPVYPQPAKTNVNIPVYLHEPAQLNILIVDISGREIYSMNEAKNSGAQNLDIDVTSYKPGVYIYKISDGEVSKTGKFIVAE